MFIKSDPKKEKKIIEDLISSDDELRRQHEVFLAEMAFKQELIEARKAKNLTQQDISNYTGLSQQAVSRMEKGAGGTIETVIRYLNAIGFSLAIKEK